MTPFDFLLYAITLFAWSTSWLALKMQLGVVDPEVSVMWRFALASAVMFMLVRIRKRPMLIPLRMHHRPAALGLFIFSLNFSLYYHGGLYVTSGLLAVMFALASIVIMMVNAIWYRRKIKLQHIIAATIGVTGVAVLYAPEISVSGDAIFALILCTIGTLSFSIGSVISASSQRAGLGVLTTNAWGMVYGTIYLAIWNLIQGHAFVIETTAAYLGALLWLAVFSSVAGFSAYLTLAGRIGVERAGYVTVVFPVFALLISSVFEGYAWSLAAVAGLALVMAGNWLILRR